MNPIAFLGELFTIDSAYVRGWRWLFSPNYRRALRVEIAGRSRFRIAAGVLETLLLMTAEIVAIVYLICWLFG